MRELITALGDKISVKDDLERIISLSPAVTEILYELGMGDRIVGLSAFCSRPAETSSVRKVGSYGSARIEVIEELRPDVIFTVTGYPVDFAGKLSKKFPVYVFELPSSVAGIVELVNRVGTVTKRSREASRIEYELLSRLGRIRRVKNKSAYVEIDLGGPVSFGFRSYITDALSLLGLESVYGLHDREWLEPDPGYVMSSDPDFIFYEPKMYSRFSQSDLDKLVHRRGWDKLKAVRNGAIYCTPGPLDFLAHHGPTFIREVMPWLEQRIFNKDIE